MAQEIARAEAAMAVLGKGRMIRHFARQAEPAEPTIGEVQMDLLAYRFSELHPPPTWPAGAGKDAVFESVLPPRCCRREAVPCWP
jgi:hypothetical protein